MAYYNSNVAKNAKSWKFKSITKSVVFTDPQVAPGCGIYSIYMHLICGFVWSWPVEVVPTAPGLFETPKMFMGLADMC